ncbi:MAG TPA: GNAT family N-acetyltransferase [Clostridiales bacterium]|nr:GNAT family N-acetyltransferase [Clostridiales bacterium]
MIRKLAEDDRALVMDYLSEEPSINLFIIGDIEAYGFEEDFQEVWGQFTDQDQLEGVLLRYNENHIPYFKSADFDISGFKDIILSKKGKIFISGKESVMKRFDGILPNHEVKTMHFCELIDPTSLDLELIDSNVKVAKEEDAKIIHDLIEQIVEFTAVDNAVERTAHKIRTKAGRIYYMDNEQGEVVTVAQTTAENSKSAMVVGVATAEAYRKQGRVSRCLTTLCNDVMEEGKTLCLFYDNPDAGKIYHKLGFKTIDNWVMVTE